MRIVGRVDDVEPEALAAQIVERGVEVPADDLPARSTLLGRLLCRGLFRRGIGFGLGLRQPWRPARPSAAWLAWAWPTPCDGGPSRGSSGTRLGLSLGLRLRGSLLRLRFFGMVVPAARAVDMAFLALEVGFELRRGSPCARSPRPWRRGSRRPCPHTAARAAGRRTSAPAGHSWRKVSRSLP